LCLIPTSVAGLRRRCDEPVDTNLYSHTAVLTTGTWGDSYNCYFVVKNASFMTLYQKDSKGEDKYDLYKIDLDLGRRICEQHDALLPTIFTEAEHDFLNSQYADVAKWMLLGLLRVTHVNYLWAGTSHGTSFKPKNWVKITDYTTGTYTLLMTNDGRWSEFYPNETWPKKHQFVTICHQRDYTDSGRAQNDDSMRALELKGDNGGIRAIFNVALLILAIIIAF